MAIKWDDTTADDGLFTGDDGTYADAFVIEVVAPDRVLLTTSGVGHDYYGDVKEAKTAAEIYDGTLILPGYANCACCSDVVIDVTLCRLCRDAGCASSKDASGEVGFWECQRDDVWSDAL